MFVWSMKTSKKKIALAAGAVVLVIAACFLIFGRGGGESYAVSAMGKYALQAGTNAERIQFLNQFGWTAQEEPVEVSDVIIPAEFNETYQQYNALQKEQGLDLSRYCGATCKKWSYTITNYPGQPEGVRANLLVLDGKVIGGDVSSVELDGFMQGFVPPQALTEASQGQQSQAPAGQVVSQPEAASSVAPESSTERETLAPDPAMPNAPTD